MFISVFLLIIIKLINLQARSISSWRTLTSTWRRRKAFSSPCSTSKFSTSNFLFSFFRPSFWLKFFLLCITYLNSKVFQLRRAGADKGHCNGPALGVEVTGGGGEVVEEPEAGEGGGGLAGGGSSSEERSWGGDSH